MLGAEESAPAAALIAYEPFNYTAGATGVATGGELNQGNGQPASGVENINLTLNAFCSRTTAGGILTWDEIRIGTTREAVLPRK